MNPRNCPACKISIPIDHGYCFDDNLNLICSECNNVIFDASSVESTDSNDNYFYSEKELNDVRIGLAEASKQAAKKVDNYQKNCSLPSINKIVDKTEEVAKGYKRKITDTGTQRYLSNLLQEIQSCPKCKSILRINHQISSNSLAGTMVDPGIIVECYCGQFVELHGRTKVR